MLWEFFVMVSVIVPLFNKAAFVRRALESIARQTYTDFELIVVDDGSSDDGPAIVESFPDSRLRLLRQANAGPGAARNAGVAVARGELIAFLDADDEWLPAYLARSVALLDAHPQAVAVTSAFMRTPPNISTVPEWRACGLSDRVYRIDAGSTPRFVVDLLAFTCWPPALVMRAQTLRHFGGFYEHRCTYGEDSFLMLKILLLHEVIVNLEPLVVYHVDASELNRGRHAPRDIDAFLRDPSEIYASCPPELGELLQDVLAARACKTACVLAYWGRWRDGRELMRRFPAHDARRLPFFARAQVAVNPLGAAAASGWRLLRRLPLA
jgi:GT2 family glycosyltransferase